MNTPSRRDFLQQSAILVAAAMAGQSFSVDKKKAHLAFSTLGCPGWTFPQTIEFAAKHGYKGIELRGILKQLDLPLCPEFNSSDNRAATLRMMKDKGLKFANLGSSATLHFAEGAERQKNLDDAKRFIDLAHDIECQNIRVFPNNFIKGQEKQVTIDLIIKGLVYLAEYAKGSRVNILMESHGDLVRIDDLEYVMKTAAHPQVGLIWDISNMWTITKESPTAAYGRLKHYIKHTHIKDAKLIGDKLEYTFLGTGDVPIFEAVDLLVKDGFKGYYSFEWEKLWHPEIAEPELAFADYPKAIKKHL